MIKICHMTSVHKSTDVRIFRKECVSLAKKKDYDVYLIAPGESREEDGVHVIGIGEVPKGRLARMMKTAKAVYKAAVDLNADIYHFHDPELLQYGAKLAAMNRYVIFDSHENTYEQIKIKSYIPKALRSTVAGAYLKRETKLIKDMDAVIFPCPINGKHPFAGRAKRTPYVDNTPMKSELFDRYDGNRDFNREPVVCHVGSLTEKRGITDLIDSCYLAGARLILGGNYYSDDYRKKLEDKESYACVDYRGFCDRDQVFDIYKEATIGASTLLRVGQYTSLGNLPTKAYEYMAVGLPTILTDFPYGREVNDKYDFALLVDPKNHEQIAEKIRYLADHPDEARRLGENGRKAVDTVFNWNTEEEKLYALYEDILGV